MQKVFTQTIALFLCALLCASCGTQFYNISEVLAPEVKEIRSSVRLTSATVDWDAREGYVSYTVVRSDTSTATFTVNSSMSTIVGTALDSHATIACVGSTTNCPNTGLSAFTNYYYFIYGRSSSGKYDLLAKGSTKTGPIFADILGGTPRYISVYGNTAVIGQRSGGIVFADISALPTVSILGRYIAGGDWFNQSHTEANYTYIANGGAGLSILNYSDPANPYLVASVTTGGSTGAVLKSGNLIYTCDSTAGLVVIDVSVLTSPRVVSSTAMSGACAAIQKNGNYLYVASSADGLNIYSITQPTSPSLVRNVATATSASDVLIRGSYAYLSAGTGGVRIIDIATPASASIVATFAASASVSSISQDGSYLYVNEGTVGTRVIDPTNPVALSQVGLYPGVGPGITTSVKVGNYLLSTGLAFLEVVDVSTPAAPVRASALAGGSSLYRMSYNHGLFSFAFAGAGLLGATIDSAGKFSVSSFLPGYAVAPNDTTYENSLLYAVAGNGRAFAIYDPSTSPPTALGSITNGAGNAIVVDGNTAYVGGAGLRINDVANPAAPTLIATSGAGNLNSVAKSGNFVYAADTTGNLRVYNVTNPAAPTQSTIALTGPWSVSIKGNILSVARQTNGVTLYDISTPGSPVQLSTIPGLGDVRSSAFYSNYLVTVGYNSQNYCIIDITDPAQPQVLVNALVTGTVFSLAVDETNETLVLGVRGAGLISLKSAFP